MASPEPAQASPVSPVLPLDVDVVKELSRPALSAMKAFNGALAANYSNCQNEWLQFLGRRWHENVALPQRLAACKSPVDLQGAWADYWSRTFSQYSEEYQRLAKLCEVTAETGVKAAARLEEDAEEAMTRRRGPYAH